MIQKKYLLLILRVGIGGLFAVSGFEKLISPYQNFLYVVQNYELFNNFLEELVARTLPWVEFLLGIFLILGLWLKWTLRSTMVLLVSFIVIVSQATLRKLPIDECGCFGQLISLPLHKILLLDSSLLMATILLLMRIEIVSYLSMDRLFEKN